MYKPNGEEPMTKQEELRRRQAAAEKAAARMRDEQNAESLRSAFCAVLSRSVAQFEEKAGFALR